MKTKYLSLIILGGAIAASLAIVAAAPSFAQENPSVSQSGVSQIQYPVPELGNCKNESECRSFCDKPENLNVCLDFAEKNGLMRKDELDTAKKFAGVGAKGPGDCRGRNECDTYCNDINNIDECVSFAEKNGLMPPKELEEAKKVQAAIKRGVKPPACKNKGECDVFCSQSENMEQCMNFALEAGFMDEREKQDAQKMLSALKRGVKPPACRGKNECDVYCGDSSHMEECMNFAIEAGMMDDRQKEESQKVLAAIKKGVKPPACRGQQECDAYCSSEEHFQECLTFAEAAGFMKPEEAEMARKTGGKGPGGCRKKEECEAFCNDPANQEACFSFAKEHDMIPKEELQRMEQGKQQFKESLSNVPEAVKTCLNESFGAETLQKFMDGTAMPSRDTGDKMRQCFEKNMGSGPMGSGGQPNFDQMSQEAKDCFKSKLGEDWQNAMKSGPSGQDAQECFRLMGGSGGQFQGEQMGPQSGEFRGGPGGCQSPEECDAYCKTHEEECKNSGQNQGGPMGSGNGQGLFGPNDQGGPGGSFDPKEFCAKSSNPEECLKNAQNSGPTGSRNKIDQGGPGFMGGTPCNSPEECQKVEQEMKGRIMNGQNPEDCAKDPSKCGPRGEGFLEKYNGIISGDRSKDGRLDGSDMKDIREDCRGEGCMRQQPGNTNSGQPGQDAPGTGIRYDNLAPWTGQQGGPGPMGSDGRSGPNVQPMGPQGQQMVPNMPGTPAQPGQPMPGGAYQPGRPSGSINPPQSGSPNTQSFSDGQQNNFQPPQGQAPMVPQSQPMEQQPAGGSNPPPPPPAGGDNPPPPPPSGSVSIRSLVGLIYEIFFPVLK